MAKQRRAVTGINCLKTEDGSLVNEQESVKKKWKERKERLMNVENTWDGRVEADVIEEPIECITEMKVENALSAMELGKAPGPTGASSEILLAAGHKERNF